VKGFCPAVLAAVLVGVATGCGSAPRIAASAPEVDVSRDPDAQAEVAVAAQPGDARVLLAGSNDSEYGTRGYGSVDGGRSWRSAPAPEPPARENSCYASDPGVAIDSLGRQQYVFLDEACDADFGRVFVSYRNGPGAPWEAPRRPVARAAVFDDDDKPSIAVDAVPRSPYRHRSYVVWTRIRSANIRVLLAASDDGGRSWPPPVRVASTLGTAVTAVGVGLRGAVYVAWSDPLESNLSVVRAPDGRHFSPRREFSPTRGPTSQACRQGVPGTPIPAQPIRCVIRNPQLAIDLSHGDHRGRVYVVYTNGTEGGVQDVYVQAFGERLKPVAGFPRRVNRPDRSTPSDQFLPAAAIDQETGDLWVCFYDTRGDKSRRRAWFTCTASLDGGKTFLTPVHAATVASDETTRPADIEFGYGEYAGIAVAGGEAHPVWTDSRRIATRGEEIFTRTLHVDRG
jgi:hypothetical protein